MSSSSFANILDPLPSSTTSSLSHDELDLPPLPPLSPLPSSPFSDDPLSSLPPLDLDLPFPPPPPESELATRLSSALSENRALRARVAALTRENRALRAAPAPRKRARPSPSATTTTLACALLLFGAFFTGSSPGTSTTAAVALPFLPTSSSPALALPRPDDAESRLAVYSAPKPALDWVVCRDGAEAARSVRGCAGEGGMCVQGAPWTVSLLVSAEAAGLNASEGAGGVAEVLAHVVSVARVPEESMGIGRVIGSAAE